MGWFARVLGREPSAPTAEPQPSRERGRRAPPIERLTTLNLERFLRERRRAVVDVWAPWCGPCRAFAPVFAEAASRHGEVVGFGKIHADHEPSLVARFGVRSIPSLLFFREGRLVRTEVGVSTPEKLERQLQRIFGDLS